MNRNTIVFIMVIYILSIANVESQDSTNVNGIKEAKSNRSIVTLSCLGVGYAGELLLLDKVFYGNDPKISFYYAHDSKSYLQVDKLQHSFCSYLEGYVGYNLLKYSGMKKNLALFIGGSLGTIIQTPKEFIDGRHFGSGFSWNDILSNIAGSVFFIGQEILFDEQVLLLKFSYSRSYYARQANGYLGYNYFQGYFRDYNGHSYWLCLNANKLFCKDQIPDWINIAAGYSANGMFGAFMNEEFYNGVKLPETQRYRQFLLSLDVDWPEIKTRSKFLKKVLNTMVFIKLPFPAVEFNSKGQLKGYWLYF